MKQAFNKPLLSWSQVTGLGRVTNCNITHSIKPKLYCGILFLPNTFCTSHGPPSLWSHLTLPFALPSLYLLCFCFICPLSINRNSHFSESSLNSTSFMKIVLNLIPVLPPFSMPKPESMFIFFCGQGTGFVCLSWYFMLGPKILRLYQPER